MTTQRQADYYETYWSDEGYNPERVLPAVVRGVLEPLTDTRVRCLDVGCGDGRTEGVWLNRRVGSFIGVDVSHSAVQTAKLLGLDARTIGDGAELPFDSHSFDLVVSLEVFEHLPRPFEAAAEISRVLKTGGTLVVTVPNVGYWQRRLELLAGIWNPLGDDRSIEEPWRDPHIRFFTARGMRAMLVSAGFSSVTIGGHDGVPWSLTVPGLRGVRGLGVLLPLYRRLEARWPAPFGLRLHAVAVK